MTRLAVATCPTGQVQGGDNPPAPARCTYRVFVHEWTCWDALIEAESAEAAEERAQQMWDDEGPDAFNLHDSGDDSIEVEEVRA